MDICSSAVGTSKNSSIVSKWLTGVFTAFAIFSVPMPSLALTPSQGKTAVLSGNFSVSGGEATYSLPISVSPGRAGHQPQLSLEYRSDGPNGNLGLGWSIGGLSAVARCGKNLATDGRWGGVQFNADDRYCLDGQRLIAITGKDGGNLTEYRLNENGYSKVISYGTAGNGPAFFKVWTKDGSVYEYGATEDSRAQLPGQAHVYKWALNKITDITGSNSINFHYSERVSGSDQKIASIDYVGGKVVFSYEARNDKKNYYFGGSLLTRNQRLKTVSVYQNDKTTEQGNYSLFYNNTPGSNQSFINRIRYCSGPECATDVTFASALNVSGNGTTATDYKQISFHDSDRNGKLSAYGAIKISADKTSYDVRDQNGAVHNSVKSFSTTGTLNNPSVSLNQCSKNQQSSYTASGNGTFSAFCKFTSCDSGNGYCSIASKGKNAGDFSGNGVEGLINGWSVVDINGDGIDDKHNFDDPTGGFKYHITGGFSGALTNVPTSSIRTSQHQPHTFVDINADGYLDVVIRATGGSTQPHVYLFDGVRYKSATKIAINAASPDLSIYFHDTNQDGYPELFYEGKRYTNNKGTIDPSSGVQIYGKNDSLQFVDYNGNGATDVVVTPKDGNATIRYGSSKQPKVTKIQEAGADYNISYKFATDPSVHKQVRYYKYPYLNTTPRRFLVSEYSKSPKGYSPTTYSYFYEGARSHYKGYGFLGFNKITRTENAAIKTVTTTTYEVNNGIKAGKPLSIVETRNGKKVSQQNFSYHQETKQGYGAKYYQVYAKTITTLALDLTSQAIKRKEVTTRTLDHFGNIVNETSDITSGIAKGGHFATSTTNQYLSTGVNNNHQIYDFSSIQNIDNFETTLSTFKAGLGRYCGTDGKVYFKPNDHIVIIHGEVDTPIVLQRYNSYYRYDTSGSSTDLDGLTTITGNLVGITATQFNTASPILCGSYVYSDIDGDGKSEFGTTTSTRTQLVSETAQNYWKIGALKVSNTVIEDKSTNLKRAVENSFNYDSNKLLRSNTTRASEYGTSASISSAKSLTNSFKYDDYGNVTESKVTGTDIANPRVSITAYDANGLFPKSQSNAKGHTTSLAYFQNGLMKQSVSPLAGRTMGYAYDAFQRLKTETRPGTNNVISHAYKLGTACTVATPQTVSCVETSAPDRGKIVVHLDYAGRKVRSLHQGFNGEWIVQDNAWDANGRKVSATHPHFLTDNSPSIVNFKYDELGREIRKDEPTASNSRAIFNTEYNGFQIKITDARGFNHVTTQNLLGHVLRKDEPEGAYQTYTYYPDGKLKDTTDSSGNVTTIGYDSLGHRKSLDDPDMGYWTYTYNALGELTFKQDANGIKTTLSYDALGRKLTEQYNTGGTMRWVYDNRGAPGTLTAVVGNGLRTDYYYNRQGLLAEVAKQTGGEKFSSHYFYDRYERVNREVRPNGIDTSPLTGHNDKVGPTDKPENRLVLDYVYNPNGYMSAVRSPKNYADEVFTSASFRNEIKQLLNDAIALANTYLERAEKYATQENFFKGKAAEYNQKTINVHTLDASSAALLAGGYRFKQWCDANGICYIRPGTWVMLHDDVVTPIDVTLDGDIYRIESTLESSTAGKRNYTTAVHKVTEAEFNSAALTAAHDYILTDYDRNGLPDLMSTKDIYVAQADSETQEELLFTAEDLDQAASIAGSRYKFYTELATALISLSETVAKESGVLCEMANQLGGSLTTAQRSNCENNKETSQADQLNTILSNAELAAANDDAAYLYYWQRRETDAWNHTLSEMLGNGLVNTYHHNARTGRPDYIATHKASQLFHKRVPGYTDAGRNIRLIEYKYDNHDNVKSRYDQFLGIRDAFEYDGLDRVVSNNVVLDSLDGYLGATPDFAGLHTVQYDKLGNIKKRSEIGDYTYSGVQAGPHAVTQANGLTYQYDDVGNMVSAKAVAGTDHTLERELEWNAFNKPTKITRNGKTVEFKYDANHSRYLKTNSDGVETFYFDKVYERVKDTNTGEVQHKHFVYADGKLIALNTQTRDAEDKLKDKQVRYLHYDALQSVDMITDGYGVVVERRSYNVWGKQRNVVQGDDGTMSVQLKAITNRGYTSHEQIEEVGLIHMNGRVYDEELGRFISADPYISAPLVSNSFNRYTYVWNNPLKFVDPTGYEPGPEDGEHYDNHEDAERGNNARHEGTGNGDDREKNGWGDNEDHLVGKDLNLDNSPDIEGEGIIFAVKYFFRWVGSFFGGPGNTFHDQVKHGAMVAAGRCRRGGCSGGTVRKIYDALFVHDIKLNPDTFERWDNMITAGSPINIGAMNGQLSAIGAGYDLNFLGWGTNFEVGYYKQVIPGTGRVKKGFYYSISDASYGLDAGLHVATYNNITGDKFFGKGAEISGGSLLFGITSTNPNPDDPYSAPYEHTHGVEWGPGFGAHWAETNTVRGFSWETDLFD